MIAEIFLIVLAIAVMILFMPVAIGVGIKILAPEWYLANRRNIILTLGVIIAVLLIGILVIFFGMAI
ncbi:hypothetical protein [Parasphingorhabdus halotolerans]|uniref:Uncharacterized protein n=1 Tax=Parasphingorhabdus halotolerans TaxID=2725558 RepID=A0A6H2DLE4_9SPHN|nr:hypothetical protein [Parasphingorhabdus halotolerans]QJB68571.1 hypothetical protein HF685_04125 [Parasphingorhabdus halotolerans]